MAVTVAMTDEHGKDTDGEFAVLPRQGDFLSVHTKGERHHVRFEVMRVWHNNMGDEPWTSLEVRTLKSHEPKAVQ